MDRAASRYLQALTSAGRGRLGDAFVGAYPHASLVLGGWRADRSDIDVLVVVDRALTSSEQSALAAAWSEEALPCPAVGLELSVVTIAACRGPTRRPAFELHMTTAPQDPKVVDGHGHLGDWDLVLHFAVCHSLGYDVFAAVPRALVLAQLVDELIWATEHASSEYAVLNACRAWRYAIDGALVSKIDGGRWARARLSGGELRLVRTAIALQSGDRIEPLDPVAARAFVLRLRDVCRQ
jgi:streptomycin 3"-adenylyltransferase